MFYENVWIIHHKRHEKQSNKKTVLKNSFFLFLNLCVNGTIENVFDFSNKNIGQKKWHFIKQLQSTGFSIEESGGVNFQTEFFLRRQKENVNGINFEKDENIEANFNLDACSSSVSTENCNTFISQLCFHSNESPKQIRFLMLF